MGLFGSLSLLPKRFHLVERRVFQRFIFCFKFTLDVIETSFEFVICTAQRTLRIDLHMPREIGHDE